MASYKDLEPCGYFGERWASRLVAVGWLESHRDLTTGDVDAAFFAALTALLVDPWQPYVTAGTQRCSLCRFTGGPGVLRYRDREITLGVANLFVPTRDRAYVAPSLIAHYIDAHGYAPPAEFREAVMRCPPMKSMPYYQLLRVHDLAKLAARP